MSDYIIKNCPAFNSKYNECHSKIEPHKLYCMDCTDCVMKQIVELCKNIDCPCEYQGADCWECSRIGAKTFADKILKLLDLQEVE
jgi:hypothetical protein